VRKYINKFHKNAKLSSIFDLDLVFMHFCCRRHWIVAIVVKAGLVLKGKIGQSG
jgi:DNA-directed RNA polymerase subunit N (RpoN/RPB10)